MTDVRFSIHPSLLRSRTAGPPLLLLVDHELDVGSHPKTLDPPPVQKWTEEGYAVGQIRCSRSESQESLLGHLRASLEALQQEPSCSWTGKAGLITYLNSSEDFSLKELLDTDSRIAAVISYGAAHQDGFKEVPYLAHISSKNMTAESHPKGTKVHAYPGSEDIFVLPAHETYHSNSAAMAHTRSLTFLKPLLGGPYFDLEAIWEEHTRLEFAARNVDSTMATMVDQPYVNHIPTLTGGIGRARLSDFYQKHFIFNNPDDTELELVSRTVGIDRVVDEFIVKLTHDRMIDWLVPGIPPTGKKIAVPFTSVVNIRGDKLYHEHISWDQATLLRQLGLLPDYLPFPYELPGGKTASGGKRLEYRLPVAGVESANKMADENAVESNKMFAYSIREVDDV